MHLPRYVSDIIERLEKGGHSAFAVGGCVRDFLLSRKTYDYDLTTSATPSEVERLLSPIKIVKTGIAHGTVTAVTEFCKIEITTFRSEGAYHDFRHPDSVNFENSLKKDLSRRDFTINAIAYNEKCGFIDLFGGRADLESKIIRCVGNAQVRFGEDALRMLRALRFSAKLDFRLEADTKAALLKQYTNLSKISKERIYKELCEIVCSDFCDLVLAQFCEVFAFCLFPFSLTKKQKADFCANAKILPYLKKDKAVRFSALLCFLDKAQLSEIFENLKADNKLRNTVIKLVSHLSLQTTPDHYCVKKLLFDLTADEANDLLDIKANSPLFSITQTDCEKIKQLIFETQKNDECIHICDLAVSGNDLKALGIKGKKISQTLTELLELVISDRLKNDKQTLINHIKKSSS